MKKIVLSALFAFGVVVGLEAAPTDTVTQADLQAILQRLSALEAQNKEQAKRIAELEGKNAELAKKADTALATVKRAPAGAVVKDGKVVKVDEGAEISESGKIVTAATGRKYYLADATANIFEPLSESGLQITPYGYLVFEAVHNTKGTEADIYADYVRKDGRGNGHQSVFSVQDSIFGIQFATPERFNGWKFSGKMEMDLAGDNANDYAFHWRHLFFQAENENGWSFLFGQTWHLWKMVCPSEIDGAWLENTGYPYRRSPQIRVTKKWDWEESSLEWRVGLVKNGPGMGGDRDGDGNEDNAASAWCLFETALIYDHDAFWEDKASGKRWLIGLGGMYGRDRLHRLSGFDGDGNGIYNGDDDDYNSQLVMLAGSVPYGDFTLCGQVFAGENLGGVQAGVGQRVGFSDIGAKGEEVRTIGGFIDLNYKLNDDWSFAVGYGFDDPSNSAASMHGEGVDGILFNDRIYADVFYNITSNFRVGAEYGRLSTRWADEGKVYDDRIQFSAWYDF